MRLWQVFTVVSDWLRDGYRMKHEGYMCFDILLAFRRSHVVFLESFYRVRGLRSILETLSQEGAKIAI